MSIGLDVKYPLFLSDLMKREFFKRFFEKYSNGQFHQNPSSGSRVVPCGRTDGRTYMTELIIAFCNFTNHPKNNDYSPL
jgi:hypothetical protein